jgi:hypothetical protein
MSRNSASHWDPFPALDRRKATALRHRIVVGSSHDQWASRQPIADLMNAIISNRKLKKKPRLHFPTPPFPSLASVQKFKTSIMKTNNMITTLSLALGLTANLLPTFAEEGIATDIGTLD